MKNNQGSGEDYLNAEMSIIGRKQLRESVRTLFNRWENAQVMLLYSKRG